MQSVKILGSRVDILSRAEVNLKFAEYLAGNQSNFIVTSNTEMYYQAYRDIEMQNIINQSDLAVPDSVGIILALRKYGYKQAELYPGIEMCAYFINKKYRIYVLGGKQEVLDRFNFPDVIIGKQNGYFKDSDEQKIIMDIQDKKPQVLLVGLGAGKQERWIAKYKKILKVPIIVGIGGAVDVLSGSKPRAPAIIRKLKLEWLFRLYKEPKRIFRQINLLWFFLAILRERKT